MAEADESIIISVGTQVSGANDVKSLASALDRLDDSAGGADSVYKSLARLDKLKLTFGTQVKSLAQGLQKLNTYKPDTAALESVKGAAKDLSDALGECAVKVGPQINSLATGLTKLNGYSQNDEGILRAVDTVDTLTESLDGKSLKIGTEVNRLVSSLNKLNEYQQNDEGILRVIDTVDALVGSLDGKSVKIGSNINTLVGSLNKLNEVNVDNSKFNAVINNVLSLASNLGDKSVKIGSDIRTLMSGLEQINSFTPRTSGLTAVIKEINVLDRALSDKSLSVAKDVNSLVNSLKKLQGLNLDASAGTNAASAVSGLVSGVSGVDASGAAKYMRSATRATRQATDATTKYAKASSSAATGVSKLAKEENDASLGALSFAQRLGEVYNSLHKVASVYFVVSTLQSMFESLANAIMTPVNAAAEYQEQMNLMTVSLGQYAQQAYEYAQRVEQCLGINAGEFLSNQGTFMTLTHGMGVASDAANTMSENLTRLSYDLGSFFNLDYSESFEKVRSAISGETESIKQLGFDLSQTRLQQIAYANGIETSVSEMTQADKAYLRYIALMEQVSWAQGDLVRTIASPANQMKVLAQQATVAARSIGNVFMPALSAILPIAVAVIKVITTLANKLAEAFGGKGVYSIDFGSGGELSDIGGAADDAADSLDGTGSSASDAADSVKELKRELMGFDEINKFSSQSDDSDSGSGGSGGSGSGSGGGSSISGIELPTDEWEFDDSFANEWVKKIEDFLDRLWAVIEPTVDIISGYIDQIKKQWDEVDVLGAFADAFVGAVDLVSSCVGAMARVLGPVLVAFNIPATLEAAFGFVAQLFTTLSDVVEQVGIVLGAFSEAVLAPVAAAMGETVRAALRAMTDALKGLSDWIGSHGDETRIIIAGICGAIAGFKAYQGVTTIIGTIKDAFKAFGTIVQPSLAYGVDAFRIALNQAATEFPSLDSAITASSGFLTRFYETMTNGTANGQRFVDGMKAAFSTMFPHITSVLANIKSGFSDALSKLKDVAGLAVRSIAKTVSSNASVMAARAKVVFDGVVTSAKATASGVIEKFSTMFPHITSVLSKVATAVTSVFSNIINGSKIMGTTLTSCIPAGAIVAAIGAVVAAVVWWATQTEDGKAAWKDFCDTASKVVGEAQKTIGAAFSRVVDALQPIISKMSEVASAIGKLALDALVAIIKGVADVIVKVATAIAKVVELLSPLINAIGSLALDAVAVGLDAINAAIEGIGSVIGVVAGGVGDFVSNLFGIEEAQAATVDSTGEASDALSEYDQKVQDNITSIEEYDDANGTLQRALEQTGWSTQDLAKYLADTDQTVDEFVSGIEDYADSVINSFQKIDTESQISLDDMVGNLESNIQTTANWSANLEKMMAMTGLDSSNALVQEMISGGPEKYAAALDEIVGSDENAAKFRQAAEDYGTSLVNTYGATVSSGAATAQSGGETLVNSTATGMESASAGAASTAQSVDQQTVEQFGSHYGEACDAGRNLTGGFGDGVAAEDMVSLAVGKAQSVCQQVATAFNGGEGYALAVSAGSNMVGGYGDGIASATPAAVSVAYSCMSQVIKALNGGTGYNQARSAGANLMGGYKDGLSSAVGSAVSVARNAMNQVNSALGSGDGTASSKGSGMMASFRSGLQSGVSGAVSVARSAAQQVQSGMGSNYNGAYSAGSNEMWGFRNGLSSVGTYDVGRNAALSAQNGVGSNYWGAFDAGKNFMYGFNNGMVDVQYTCYRNARAIADNCVDIINSALSIHSPSRVTRKTGEYFSMGLALGIADQAKAAYSEVSDVADGVIDALDVTKEVASLGESIGEGFGDGMSSALDTGYLSSVAAASGAISAEASRASWGVQAPRRTSHEVSYSASDDNEMMQTIASAVAQGVVSVQMANNTAGTPDTTIVLRVGNEELARAVAKGNDSLARRGVVRLS